MTNQHKILIIGAGPAGTSCAISLLKAGYKKVTIIDKQNFPRHLPGETLHPGIEPLLKQLGVLDRVLDSNFPRHKGIENIRNGIPIYETYNEDLDWKGFQLFRTEFDTLLLTQAIKLGVRFQGGVTPVKVIYTGDRITSIDTTTDKFEANYFIDATGKRAWLANSLGIKVEKFSPRRIAYYGYVKNSNFATITPKLIWDNKGWTWVSSVKQNLTAWVRLILTGHEKIGRVWVPDILSDGEPTSPRKAVDVTWRKAETCCKENCYLVGDAAFVLDPGSSHGVLKAIMSGIMVSHLINKSGGFSTSSIQKFYNVWINRQFHRDVLKLKDLYKNF